MLSDDVRSRLQELIRQELADPEAGCVPCSLKQPGALGMEGLMGVGAARLVFASEDFVRGLVSRAIARTELSGLRMEEAFLGREITAKSPSGELRIKCRRDDDLAAIEADLQRLGWFGPDPEPAEAASRAASTPPPPVPAPTSTSAPAPAAPTPAPPSPPRVAVAPQFLAAAPEPAPPAVEPDSLESLFFSPEEPEADPGAAVDDPPTDDSFDGFFDTAGAGLEVEFGQDEPTPVPSRATGFMAPTAGEHITCPECDRPNEPHYAYCLACGARLPAVGELGPPALMVLEGEPAGRLFPIGAEVTIGRTADNDVHLPMSSLSRRHARVFRQGEDWMVVDLASSNGTRVNGRTINGPTVLEDGDTIGLGDGCELMFMPGDAHLVSLLRGHTSAEIKPPAAADASLMIVLALAVAMFVAGLVAYLLLGSA